MKTTTEPQFSIIPADAPVRIDRSGSGVQLHLPEGSEASLVETFKEEAGSEARLQVSLSARSHLTHYKLVDEGAKANHYSMLEVQVGASAAFDSHVFLFGGARIRNTIHVRLDGDNASCSLNGLYLATDDQVVETHTLIDHIRPHGTSREYYKGILDGKAQALFDGLIIVEKDAQKTDSAQLNKNLLLSSEASAKSNPELKILANDVKCKHGSTIGQINPEALFYLRSRGISLAEARHLLIYGFASEMIDQVRLTDLQESLSTLLVAKFMRVYGHV